MTIDDFKAQFDILEVLQKVGARMGRTKELGWWAEEVALYCPFCSDLNSAKPAGRANTGKQVYHCWSCGFGGDVINIAKEYLGADFNAAVRWLAATFEVSELE